MIEYWVLVADESKARLFSTDKIRTELKECQTFTNPDAHLFERELVTEGMGRSYDSHGQHRHAMEPSTSARDSALLRFVKNIVEHLEKGATNGEYRHLVLIAPPDMLGLIRRELGQNTRKRIHHAIAKELIKASPEEIIKHLFV